MAQTVCSTILRLKGSVFSSKHLRVFVKGKHSDVPKADQSYTTALARVHIRKPAHCGDTAFTDKTGGCNSKADVVERMFAQAP